MKSSKSLKLVFDGILQTIIGMAFLIFIAYGVYSHFNPIPSDPNLHHDYYQFDPEEKPSKAHLRSIFDDLTKELPIPLRENALEKGRYSGSVWLSRVYQDTQGNMAEQLKIAMNKQGGWTEVAEGDYYCFQQVKLEWSKDTYQTGAFDEKIPALWVFVSWDKNGDCRKWHYHQERIKVRYH